MVAQWQSKTARDAALKAANRDVELICLVDVDMGKLHAFRGHRRKLEDCELTEYTRRRGITHKPTVEKLAYHNCRRAITRADVDDVARLFLDVCD